MAKKAIVHEWKVDELRLIVLNTYDLYARLEMLADDLARRQRDMSDNLLVLKLLPLVKDAAAMESACYRTNMAERRAAAVELAEDVRESAEWLKAHVYNQD